MSDIKKIIGVTVGTTINPQMLRRGKADKVEGATAGNFAALDASGNLTDSDYSGKDIDELFGMIPDVEYALNTKGRVLPLAYFEYLPGKESLEAKYPATNSLGKYAWIGTPINELYYSEMNTWKKKTPSPNDTYLFENRIYFYKNGELIEVTYLRDINAVSESVIAALPIYNGEVEENTEVIENLPVTVDFSEGDQTITAPDGYLVKSAILQKPETLVPENIADGVTVLGVTGTHEGGGGVGEGYVTITFMNGDTVLFTRPVYIGDDCPDPVAQTRIETPTKESTAQYDYTFSGWGTADGGSADDTALNNITADKTLYAAYTAAVRSYTIIYYDDDGSTVLKTETLAYGSIPSYTPTKQGYALDGWTPNFTQVIGDATYTAVWMEQKALKDYSFADLDAMPIDEMKAKFTAGDQGPVIGGVYSVLLGFDNMELADGSGKVKMILGIPLKLYQYISGANYPAWGAGKDWSTCTFRTNTRGASYCLTQYPVLATYGKSVKVKYTASDGTIKETTDVLFPPSLSQLGYTDAPNEGEKFDAFSAKTLSEKWEGTSTLFYGMNAFTRTLDASSGSVYSVAKGSVPNLTTATTMNCAPYYIVCI